MIPLHAFPLRERCWGIGDLHGVQAHIPVKQATRAALRYQRPSRHHAASRTRSRYLPPTLLPGPAVWCLVRKVVTREQIEQASRSCCGLRGVVEKKQLPWNDSASEEARNRTALQCGVPRGLARVRRNKDRCNPGKRMQACAIQRLPSRVA